MKIKSTRVQKKKETELIEEIQLYCKEMYDILKLVPRNPLNIDAKDRPCMSVAYEFDVVKKNFSNKRKEIFFNQDKMIEVIKKKGMQPKEEEMEWFVPQGGQVNSNYKKIINYGAFLIPDNEEPRGNNPIIILEDPENRNYFLTLDGAHRITAAKKRKESKILAYEINDSFLIENELFEVPEFQRAYELLKKAIKAKEELKRLDEK